MRDLKTTPVRSLPRVFIPGASPDSPIEIPEEELHKLRKVLRLSTGDEVAVLPNDGSLLRCVLDGRRANPTETLYPKTEPGLNLIIAQSLPKGDKLEEIVRACTEIGVNRFWFFNSDRTIVSWDEVKVAGKLRRLETIAREACEISFRTRLPVIEWISSLDEILAKETNAVVLSEVEGLRSRLSAKKEDQCLVVGPEGGWSPSEIEKIGDRAVTMGPRVLRVDHAAAAAAAILLLDHE